jgi:dephospho-CoA kinase
MIQDTKGAKQEGHGDAVYPPSTKGMKDEGDETRSGRSLLIGLTGRIATGKSTVARMLSALGAVTIDADRVAHRVMRPDTPVHAEVVEAFGPQILTPDGDIDRRRLGRLVFADQEALARLEAVVHPATLEAVDRRIAATSADVVVIEAIKLIESGLADRCDSVWVTTCRPEQQMARILEERDLSRDEARQRVDAQRLQGISGQAQADVVIDNGGSRAATWRQVVAAWRHLVGDIDPVPEYPLGNERSSGIIDDC